MYLNDNRSTFPNGRNFSYELPPGGGGPYKNLDGNKLDAWSPPNNYIQDFLKPYLHYQIVGNTAANAPGPNNPNDAGPVNLVWRDPALQSGNYGQPFMEQPQATHYRYNIYYAEGYKTSRVRHSSIAMLFYCEIWPNWTVGQYPHYQGTKLAAVNVGYVDGHIETHTYAEFMAGLYPLNERLPDGVPLPTSNVGVEGYTPFYQNGWAPPYP